MSRKVYLTTKYEIDLEDEEGLEHLFNATIGEILERYKNTDEFSKRGFGIVYDMCICELYYVAGQLRHMGSGLDTGMLLDEFKAQWDRVAEKLDSEDSKKYIIELLCNRRMQRGTDCEYWIVDGKNKSGEVINGIGSLIILYTDGSFIVQGNISKEYSLSCTEDELQQFLEGTLGRFGIDVGSGGTLQFMCNDYDIELSY